MSRLGSRASLSVTVTDDPLFEPRVASANAARWKSNLVTIVLVATGCGPSERNDADMTGGVATTGIDDEPSAGGTSGQGWGTGKLDVLDPDQPAGPEECAAVCESSELVPELVDIVFVVHTSGSSGFEADESSPTSIAFPNRSLPAASMGTWS